MRARSMGYRAGKDRASRMRSPCASSRLREAWRGFSADAAPGLSGGRCSCRLSGTGCATGAAVIRWSRSRFWFHVQRADRAKVRIPPGSKPAHAKMHSDLRLHKFSSCPRQDSNERGDVLDPAGSNSGRSTYSIEELPTRRLLIHATRNEQNTPCGSKVRLESSHQS